MSSKEDSVIDLSSDDDSIQLLENDQDQQEPPKRYPSSKSPPPPPPLNQTVELSGDSSSEDEDKNDKSSSEDDEKEGDKEDAEEDEDNYVTTLSTPNACNVTSMEVSTTQFQTPVSKENSRENSVKRRLNSNSSSSSNPGEEEKDKFEQEKNDEEDEDEEEENSVVSVKENQDSTLIMGDDSSSHLITSTPLVTTLPVSKIIPQELEDHPMKVREQVFEGEGENQESDADEILKKSRVKESESSDEHDNDSAISSGNNAEEFDELDMKEPQFSSPEVEQPAKFNDLSLIAEERSSLMESSINETVSEDVDTTEKNGEIHQEEAEKLIPRSFNFSIDKNESSLDFDPPTFGGGGAKSEEDLNNSRKRDVNELKATDELISVKEEEEEEIKPVLKKIRSTEITKEDLPENVEILRNENSTVYLVGTAHFSQESENDVSKTIRAVQPDVVMVELCPERKQIIHLDERDSKIRDFVFTDTEWKGALRKLLFGASAKMMKELEMVPGGEVRRGWKEAKLVPGCLLFLGDRAIDVTLNRAWNSLSFFEKIKFVSSILFSAGDKAVTKDVVQNYKQKDFVQSILKELADDFPSMSQVFIQERDLYLANSLRIAGSDSLYNQEYKSLLLSPVDVDEKSKLGEKKIVVGIVGLAHVKGILENWENHDEKKIREIGQKIQPGTCQVVMQSVVKISLCSAVLFGLYKLSSKILAK